MIHISEYIRTLDFSYVVSYSGLRGEEFEKLNSENEYKIWQLEMSLKNSFFRKKRIKKQIDELILKNSCNSRIVDKTGELHESAKLIHRFSKDDSILKEIIQIFYSKTQNQSAIALCAPIYRDAIVFYSDSDTIIGVLHICFSCHRMINEHGEFLEVNDDTFHKLKEQLIKIGHEIDE